MKDVFALYAALWRRVSPYTKLIIHKHIVPYEAQGNVGGLLDADFYISDV